MSSTASKEEVSASNGSVQGNEYTQAATPSQQQEVPNPYAQIPFSPQLEGEALEAAILKQVEYYFSKENLAKDTFLVSQMDLHFNVPLQTIAGFKMLKRLTTDLNLVISAVQNSKFVIVDPERLLIRPNLDAFRDTIILRDIPSTVDPEEIKALFEDTGEGDILSLQSEMGDTWHVTFENEETVVRKLPLVLAKQFRGKSVEGTIKAESIFRTEPWGAPMIPMGMPDPSGMPYYPGQMPYYMVPEGWEAYGYPVWEGAQGYSRNYENKRGGGGGYRRGGRQQNREGNYRNRGGKGADSGVPRKRRNSQGHSQKPANLVPADFPPLPGAVEAKQSGYSEPFTAYSKEQLVDIVRRMEVSKPSGLENAKVVLEKPIVDLEVTKPFPKKETAAEVARRVANAKNSKVGKEEEKKKEEKAKESKEHKAKEDAKNTTATHTTEKPMEKNASAHKTESSK